MAELGEEDLEVAGVIRVPEVLRVREEVQAQGVQEGQKETLVRLGSLEYLAFKEMTASQEPKAPLVLPDQKDLLDQWEQEERQVHLVIKGKLGQMESLDPRVSPVFKVLRVHLDHKVLRVRKVRQALMEPKAPKEERGREE